MMEADNFYPTPSISLSLCFASSLAFRGFKDNVDAAVYSAKLGIRVQRVMTDNGACYGSRALGLACKRLGLKHIRTKPYTPRPNGKAERVIQTALREWAYAKAYQRSLRSCRTWLDRLPSGQGSNPPTSTEGKSDLRGGWNRLFQLFKPFAAELVVEEEG